MTQTAARSETVESTAKSRQLYAIFIALAVLFIFLQSLTAGEFIADGLSPGAKEVWTTVHGFIAYPVMVFSLAATIVAFRELRTIRFLTGMTALLFAGSVAQWLLGHAITTLGMDWVVPFHVMLAFVIYGLAIALSMRTVSIYRSTRR